MYLLLFLDPGHFCSHVFDNLALLDDNLLKSICRMYYIMPPMQYMPCSFDGHGEDRPIISK